MPPMKSLLQMLFAMTIGGSLVFFFMAPSLRLPSEKAHLPDPRAPQVDPVHNQPVVHAPPPQQPYGKPPATALHHEGSGAGANAAAQQFGGHVAETNDRNVAHATMRPAAPPTQRAVLFVDHNATPKTDPVAANLRDTSISDPGDPRAWPKSGMLRAHPPPTQYEEHCFDFDGETACYTLGEEYASPCFKVRGIRRCMPLMINCGFPKTGTSSLFAYLKAHPDFVPPRVKETDFFSHWLEVGHSYEYYTNLFPDKVQVTSVVGEATTKYGTSLPTAQRIKQAIPMARLIFNIRDPVRQLYSNYLMNVDWVDGEIKNGRDLLPMKPFPEFVRHKQFGLGCMDLLNCFRNWAFECAIRCRRLGEGVYVDWIQHWEKQFSKDQILVVQTELLKSNPLGVMRQVEIHLGLKPHNYGSALDTVINVAADRGIYQPHPRQGFLAQAKENPIDVETRRVLLQFYDPHNKRLEEHIGETLDWEKESDLPPSSS